MGNMTNAMRHSDTGHGRADVLGGNAGYMHGMRHSDSGVFQGHMAGLNRNHGAGGPPGAQLTTEMLEQLKMLHIGSLRGQGQGFPLPSCNPGCRRQPPVADNAAAVPSPAEPACVSVMGKDEPSSTMAPSPGPGSLSSVSSAGRPTLEFLLRQQPPQAAAPAGAEETIRAESLERRASAASIHSILSSEGFVGSPKDGLLGNADQQEEADLTGNVLNFRRVASQGDGSLSGSARADSTQGSPREQVCIGAD